MMYTKKTNDFYPDLTFYENLYDDFDAGHNKKHMESVRNFAVYLSKIYAPKLEKLAYIAATLHDIGLLIGRDQHEIYALDLIQKDNLFKEYLSKRELNQILSAVKEHRASNGKPKTILAKIISDADRSSCSLSLSLQRCYGWGKKNIPELDEKGQIRRACKYLIRKFGINGQGTRLYFNETKQILDFVYAPLIQIELKDNIKKLKKIVNT